MNNGLTPGGKPTVQAIADKLRTSEQKDVRVDRDCGGFETIVVNGVALPREAMLRLCNNETPAAAVADFQELERNPYQDYLDSRPPSRHAGTNGTGANPDQSHDGWDAVASCVQ